MLKLKYNFDTLIYREIVMFLSTVVQCTISYESIIHLIFSFIFCVKIKNYFVMCVLQWIGCQLILIEELKLELENYSDSCYVYIIYTIQKCVLYVFFRYREMI